MIKSLIKIYFTVGFLDSLKELLSDSNPMVVANAVAALSEINEASLNSIFQVYDIRGDPVHIWLMECIVRSSITGGLCTKYFRWKQTLTNKPCSLPKSRKQKNCDLSVIVTFCRSIFLHNVTFINQTIIADIVQKINMLLFFLGLTHWPTSNRNERGHN